MIGLVALVVVCLAALLVLGNFWTDTNIWWQRETLKALGQVGVVGVLAAMVKFILAKETSEREKRQERQLEWRAFQDDVLAEFGSAHRRVYKIRRLLLMKDTRPNEIRTSMLELMDVRNELGSIGHRLKPDFDLDYKVARNNIKKLREYLETVTDGFLQDGLVSEAVRRFIADAEDEDSSYFKGFKVPYQKAKDAILSSPQKP